MGARGPLKIAKHLAVVPEGSVAADVAPRAPKKPAAVEGDGELSGLWDDLVPELDQMGLLAPSDGPALELALRHFLMARKASVAVVEVAVHDHHNGSEKKNPAEAVFRAESEMFLKYAQQLGLTFVSRARTPAKGDADGEANPFKEAAGS